MCEINLIKYAGISVDFMSVWDTVCRN